MSDGNFLAVNNLFGGNTDSGKLALLKYDSDLNMIWKNIYSLPFKYSTVYDLVEGSDKAIYLYFQFSFVSQSRYADYWAIAKFDADGNFSWCNTYKPQDSHFMLDGSLVELNDHLYFVSEYSGDNYTTYLFKINKTTGELVWTRALKIPGRSLDLSEKMVSANDKIYISGTTSLNGDQLRGVLLSVNENGNVEKCKTLSSANSIVSIAAMDVIDDKIVAGGSISDFVTFHSLHIQFDPDLNIRTALSFDRSDYAADITHLSSGSILEAGVIYRTNYTGDFFIRKRQPNGQLGLCYQKPVILDEISETIEVKNIVVNRNTLVLPRTNTVHYFEDYWPTNIITACQGTPGCATLELTGALLTCNTADNLTYTARRNSTCTQAVMWNYEEVVEKISNTDSTITVRFNKPGTFKISAGLFAGCGDILEDSLLVVVHSRAAVQSGKDKTLCKDSILALTPGRNFVNYQWQDGSTDSVLFVSSPGKYYVEVTDYCNNIFSDTFQVHSDSPADLMLPDEIITCFSDTVKLSPASGFSNYQWKPAQGISTLIAQNVSVYPAVDTKYSVLAKKSNGCSLSDSVLIRVSHSPAINLGSDTSFCFMDSINLSAGNGFNEYIWNNGSQSTEIIVKTAGIYSVLAKYSNGCFSKDTLVVHQVYQLPVVNLGSDFNICQGEQKTLDAGTFNEYLWNDVARSRYMTIGDVGKYRVQVTDNNNCKASDTIEIKALFPKPSDFLKPTDSLCQYDKIQLIADGKYVVYKWSTGSREQKLTVDKPGRYMLTVIDTNGCIGNDTIRIIEKECLAGMYTPGAFTPNDDKINDVFQVKAFGKLLSFKMQIYNRYGQLIFETNNAHRSWDGRVNGTFVNAGTFVYQCRYQFEGSSYQMKKGTIVLIR